MYIYRKCRRSKCMLGGVGSVNVTGQLTTGVPVTGSTATGGTSSPTIS